MTIEMFLEFGVAASAAIARARVPTDFPDRAQVKMRNEVNQLLFRDPQTSAHDAAGAGFAELTC